jgi:secreted trypsin-like serine protease
MRLSCPVAALLLVGLSVCLAVQNPSSSPLDYPDSRIVDAKNKFANVGALITIAEKNDAGVPEGPLGFCTGTLIEERVLLTAGHCVCPGLPSPLPGEVCNGDSGGPIFLDRASGNDPVVVGTVSYTGECRAASLHARIDSDAVQSWITQTIKTNVKD